jgi:Arm DNA-binding domain
MRLARANIERLSLPAGVSDRIVFDAALPGFGLRLREGGKGTWLVQYRVGTKQRRVTLGTLDAEEARKRAKSALSKVHLGHDPQLEKAEARAQSAVTLGSSWRPRRGEQKPFVSFDALCMGDRRGVDRRQSGCWHEQGGGGNLARPGAQRRGIAPRLVMRGRK